MNQLHGLAMSQGLCRKTKLWSRVGRKELEALALDPWASRRRQEVDFSGATKVERNSGVWIAGQYVGRARKKLCFFQVIMNFLSGSLAIPTSLRRSLWSQGKRREFALQFRKIKQRLGRPSLPH